MHAKYHIKQCAIEFRVTQAEFARAILHYESVFGVSHRKTDQPELVLLAGYEKKKRRFYVGIRAMAEGSTVLGPVVYWFTESNIQDAYDDILNGQKPDSQNEPPEADQGGHYRTSVIDAFDNRFGSINPDYPLALAKEPPSEV
jgi:predicted enzyme related to lactoylglutathione lyase